MFLFPSKVSVVTLSFSSSRLMSRWASTVSSQYNLVTMNSKFETRTKKTAAIARPCCWDDGPKERGCEEVSYEGMQKKEKEAFCTVVYFCSSHPAFSLTPDASPYFRPLRPCSKARICRSLTKSFQKMGQADNRT